jgi:hypothetical protein
LHHGRLPRRPPLVPRGGREAPPRCTLENIPARSPAGPAAVWVRIEARAQLAYQHSFVHVVARLVKLLRGLRRARGGRASGPVPPAPARRRRAGAAGGGAVGGARWRDFSRRRDDEDARDPLCTNALWFPNFESRIWTASLSTAHVPRLARFAHSLTENVHDTSTVHACGALTLHVSHDPRSTMTTWIGACARVSLLCVRVSMLMPDPRPSPLECTTSSGDDLNRLTRNGHARSCSKMVPRARTKSRRGVAPSIWRPLGPADSRLNRRRGPCRHPCRSRTCGGAPP